MPMDPWNSHLRELASIQEDLRWHEADEMHYPSIEPLEAHGRGIAGIKNSAGEVSRRVDSRTFLCRSRTRE